MRHAVLPMEVPDIDLLMDVIETVDADFLPKFRWLLLGPYADSRLLPPGLCVAPSTLDVRQILHQLDQQGFAEVAQALKQLAGTNCQARIERNLNHLESLASESWNHPAQVLNRPWDLEHLLALCQRRMDQAGVDRKARLQTILPKLQRAKEVEDRAAERRRKLRKSTQGGGQ